MDYIKIDQGGMLEWLEPGSVEYLEWGWRAWQGWAGRFPPTFRHLQDIDTHNVETCPGSWHGSSRIYHPTPKSILGACKQQTLDESISDFALPNHFPYKDPWMF